nr:VCBS domain-containing protein [Methylovulum sp.]
MDKQTELEIALATGENLDAVLPDTSNGSVDAAEFAHALESALSQGTPLAEAFTEAKAAQDANVAVQASLQVPVSSQDQLLSTLSSGQQVNDALSTLSSDSTAEVSTNLVTSLSEGHSVESAMAQAQDSSQAMVAAQASTSVPVSAENALTNSLSSPAQLETAISALPDNVAQTPAFQEALASGSNPTEAIAQATVESTALSAAESSVVTESNSLMSAMASGENVSEKIEALAPSTEGLSAAQADAMTQNFEASINSSIAEGAADVSATVDSAQQASAQLVSTVVQAEAQAAASPQAEMMQALASGANVAEVVTSVGGAAAASGEVAEQFQETLSTALAEGTDLKAAMSDAETKTAAVEQLAAQVQSTEANPQEDMLNALASGENLTAVSANPAVLENVVTAMAEAPGASVTEALTQATAEVAAATALMAEIQQSSPEADLLNALASGENIAAVADALAANPDIAGQLDNIAELASSEAFQAALSTALEAGNSVEAAVDKAAGAAEGKTAEAKAAEQKVAQVEKAAPNAQAAPAAPAPAPAPAPVSLAALMGQAQQAADSSKGLADQQKAQEAAKEVQQKAAEAAASDEKKADSEQAAKTQQVQAQAQQAAQQLDLVQQSVVFNRVVDEIIEKLKEETPLPVAQADNAEAYEQGALTSGSDSLGNMLTDGSADTGLDIKVTKIQVGESLNEQASNVSRSIAVSGLYGTLTLTENGAYEYQLDNTNLSVQALNDGEQLIEIFSYQIADRFKQTTEATLSLIIHGSNDAPLAVADTAQTNNITVGNVLDNDTDVDVHDNKIVTAIKGGVLGEAVVGQYGSVVLTADGAYVYQVDTTNAVVNALTGEQSITEQFIYTMQDNAGVTSTAALTVTIIANQNSPVAATDNYSVQEDGSLIVTATDGVLVNDSSPLGDVLTAIVAKQPSFGHLALDSTGAFVYTPDADFNGEDSFIYQTIAGQLGSNLVTVNVQIAAVNDAPSFSVIAELSSVEDAGGQVIENSAFALSAGASNEAAQVLSFSLSVDKPELFTEQPTLDSTGKLSYTAAANASGTAIVTVKLQDDGGTEDGGVEQSAAQQFTITVTGVNDAPEFISGGIAIVDEGAAVSTVVFTAEAHDVDANSQLSYSLDGVDKDYLTIDTNTGEVRLINPATFSEKASYTFTVVATDNGLSGQEPYLQTSHDVLLTVMQHNLAPQLNGETEANVAENSEVGTAIYTAKAIDPNAFSILTYSLTGKDAEFFSINSLSGVVTLNVSPDYESQTSYQFSITVADNGEIPLTSSQDLTVTVTNTNEAPTLTTELISFAENALSEGAVVVTSTAIDPDNNSVLTYSLTGNDAALFTIDSNTGTVVFSAIANYEVQANYDFNVVVTDNALAGEGEVLLASQAISLAVLDVNEAPVMSSGQLGVFVTGTDTVTPIYHAQATDVDAGAVLTFSLTGADAELVTINTITGEVTLNATADFTLKDTYNFDVIVTDNGGLTASKSVSLTVTEFAINLAPEFILASAESIAYSVTENQTDVAIITASDPNINDSLTYSLAGGSDQALFTIDTASGLLSFIQAPDYEQPTDTEANNTYDVIVQVSDGLGGDTQQAISVQVTDVKEDVSTVAPSIALTEATDSGLSAHDNLTNQSLIGVTGAAEAGATITVQAASGQVLGTALTDEQGLWTLDNIELNSLEASSTVTGNALFTLTAQSVDVFGNQSEVSSLAITLDTTLPAAPVSLSLDPASDSGELGDYKTNNLNPSFIVQLPADAEVGAQLRLDADLDGSGSFATSMTEPIILTEAHLAEGSVSIQVSANNFPDNLAVSFKTSLSDTAGNSALSNPANDTTSISFVTDFDGLSPATEAAGVAGGDFNNDGLQDALQADVATAPMVSADAFGQASTGNNQSVQQSYGALIGGDADGDGVPDNPGAIQLSNISVTPASTANSGLMLQELAAEGLGANSDVINFSASSNTEQVDGFIDADPAREGVQVRFTLSLGDTGVIADKVLKIRLDGSYFDYTATSGDVDGGQLIDTNADGRVDRIILTITDNGIGDTNSAVGVIDDPLFLAAPNTAPDITSNEGTDTATIELNEGTLAVTTVVATDAESDTIEFSISGGTDAALFSIDAATGALAFISTPVFAQPTDSNADNHYDVSVSASDGKGGVTSQTLDISVASVNEAPVAINDEASAVESGGTGNNQQGAVVTGNVLSNDTDSNAADTKTVGAESVGSFVGSYGSLVMAADGSYVYTVDDSNSTVEALADSSQTLTEIFNYTVEDSGGLTSSATLTITVQGANDAPVGVVDEAIATTTISGNVLSNDTDVDTGDSKTISASSQGNLIGSYGSVVLAADGSYVYTVDDSNSTVKALADSSQTLTDTINYTVEDSGGLTSSATLTITVQGANDAPVGVDDSTTTTDSITGNVLSNDTDVDTGDTSTVTLVSGGSVGVSTSGQYGAITLNADGGYSYVVDNTNTDILALSDTETLTETFAYTLQDAGGLTSTANLTITVKGESTSLTAADDSATGVLSATGNVLTNDTGTSIVVSAVNGNAVGSTQAGQYGNLVVNSDGSYTYATDNTNQAVQALRLSSQTLTDAFTYTIKDTSGQTKNATLSITVQGANDAPVAVK